MPAIMFRPAAITAGGSSWSRSGSVAAIAGTITCSRSSSSAPGGSAACAAWPAATASGCGRQARDGTDWDGADWDGADWDGADWDGADWDGADWDGTDWDGADWDGADWDGAGGNRPAHSHAATSSKLRRTARSITSAPRYRSPLPAISVIADSITMSALPACRRGRPRRASRSTSPASNRLPRPSAAFRRNSTPRLT